MNPQVQSLLVLLAKIQVTSASLQHAMLITAAAAEKGEFDDATIQAAANKVGTLHKGMQTLFAQYQKAMGEQS